MPQVFTHRLNKTISAALVFSASPPDSLSVRIEGLEDWAEVLIDGIAWGVCNGTEAALDGFDSGRLQVIRNEKFDGTATYGTATIVSTKEVAFEDAIVREEKFRYVDFRRPLKLQGTANYLIVFPAPRENSAPGASYDCSLTVRGRIRRRRRSSPEEE